MDKSKLFIALDNQISNLMNSNRYFIHEPTGVRVTAHRYYAGIKYRLAAVIRKLDEHDEVFDGYSEPEMWISDVLGDWLREDEEYIKEQGTD